jgi:hypothetical protein
MLRPESYAEPPRSVELRQTHISWVFLADDWVYKVKKPVRFDFLDYSTLARRLFFCREEVRLNARLAPGIYWGAVPILAGEGKVRVCAGRDALGHWPVVEYAVKIRRLPAGDLLDARLRDGRLGMEEIRAVACRIAAFHQQASTAGADRFGTPEAVLASILDDLRETAERCGGVFPEAERREIEGFYRSFSAEHRDLFARRLAEGRIREGHGDLRAEHVCLGDPIVIVDCIEFSERLRTIDVASDIGFLAMDLDRLGESSLARGLLTAYAECSGDPGVVELFPFYGCYRALVRGKVETLKSLEPEVDPDERNDARLRARRYFRTAVRYARGAPRPGLVIVCGPSGTGKTTAGKLLAADTGFPLLRSDVVRKRLAGLAPTARVEARFLEGIYTPEMSRRTYERLREEAERHLAAGDGAIVEATFLAAAHRRPFAELAQRRGLPLVVVECRARESEVLRRLARRAADPEEVSDAGVEVYRRQAPRFEPPEEIPPERRIVLDTEADLDGLPDRVRSLLEAG